MSRRGVTTTLAVAFFVAAAAQAAPPPSFRMLGCTSVETPWGMGTIDRIAHVYFDSGSARIGAQASATLDNYVARYDAPAFCHVFIDGHADRVGSAGDNLELSRRRADAVATYLRRRGLAAPMTIEFYGETRALVETPDGAAEPDNRRVTLYVDRPPTP